MEEMTAIRDEFATPRRTTITFDPGDMGIEDLIDDEDLVVTLSSKGYVKSITADQFRVQGRGGRGVQGARLREQDVVTHVLTSSRHAELLFFTNLGRVFRLRAHQIPLLERTARGTAVVNLLQLGAGENVLTIIDTREYETNRYLFFVTAQGQVKKTRFTDYGNIRQNGLIAVVLRDDDRLVTVLPTSGDDDVLLVASSGQTIRFQEDQVRPMGRAAAGVRGMHLRARDRVVAAGVARAGLELLTITDVGYGKRTPVAMFPRKGRGTMGVRGIRLSDGRGSEVAVAAMVETTDDIILMSQSGVLIRTTVSEIASQGRDAGGVRIMNLGESDRVSAVAVAAADELLDDEDELPGGRRRTSCPATWPATTR